ncbi:MAG TPA: sialate O-acetylesterase, partial [Prolixibacteraceae bacterium]|nr:sialate O-acetylesterase [Prolixibacteraceae bacterium]
MMRWLLALLFVWPAWIAGAQEDARFASIFSDNMVLQQQTEVNLWGFAQPDEQLLLRCSWLDVALPVQAKADGHWAVSVKTEHGSLQPCSVSLTDSKGRTTTLSNVLIGEVWLCSGQSNMEMILMDRPEWNLLVEGSEEEIARADNPHIRFVNIQRRESFTPQTEVLSHNWRISTPNEVKWLSAVAYFFGKKLTAELQLPVGLIVSSYGGSPVQSWIPSEIIDAESRYHSVKKERGAEQ